MQREKTFILRLICCILALCLVVPIRAMADTIDEVESRQEELHKENEILEAELETLKADEAKLLDYHTALEEKIDLTEKKIDIARESISVMDKEIGILEKKLEVSKQEHQNTIDTFAQRIRSLYMTGSVSTLEILLDSSSFSEFSIRMEMISRVTQHDQKLLDRITEYLEDTKQDRENIRAMREQTAQSKKGLEAAQEELRELQAENEALIAELKDKQLLAETTIAANEEEDAALEEQIQDLIRQKNEEERRKQQADQGIIVTSPSPGMHDDFLPCWPLPGTGVESITGHFGDMYDNGPHNGLDIGADYGTPIVATQAGQVLSAEYHYSWGNNVLIWHNDTFATRYAHMSSIAVSPGEYVEQGQIIGYVGSTGYSFGNHLHYEVYYNGSRVNPDPYLGI